MKTYLIRRTALMFFILLAVFLFAGCGDKDDTGAETAEAAKEAATEATGDVVEEVAEALSAADQALVEKIAAISAAVDKAPATAEVILKKFDMNVEEYEAAIFKIAESPSLTDAFNKAKAEF